jgi:hypothetical protein
LLSSLIFFVIIVIGIVTIFSSKFLFDSFILSNSRLIEQKRLLLISHPFNFSIKIKLASMSIAAIRAIVNNHAQAANQIAAVAHMFAAVVSPLVLRPIFIIAQAHKNPTHDTTCAAILPGSLFVA